MNPSNCNICKKSLIDDNGETINAYVPVKLKFVCIDCSLLPRAKAGRPKQEVKKIRDIKAYNKEYYKNNKEKYISDDYFCKPCNVILSSVNKLRHNKSATHKRNESKFCSSNNSDCGCTYRISI